MSANPVSELKKVRMFLMLNTPKERSRTGIRRLIRAEKRKKEKEVVFSFPFKPEPIQGKFSF